MLISVATASHRLTRPDSIRPGPIRRPITESTCKLINSISIILFRFVFFFVFGLNKKKRLKKRWAALHRCGAASRFAPIWIALPFKSFSVIFCFICRMSTNRRVRPSGCPPVFSIIVTSATGIRLGVSFDWVTSHIMIIMLMMMTFLFKMHINTCTVFRIQNESEKKMINWCRLLRWCRHFECINSSMPFLFKNLIRFIFNCILFVRWRFREYSPNESRVHVNMVAWLTWPWHPASRRDSSSCAIATQMTAIDYWKCHRRMQQIKDTFIDCHAFGDIFNEIYQSVGWLWLCHSQFLL